MTQQQAETVALLAQRYCGRPAGARTLARVGSGGVLLPMTSAWALFTASMMAWQFVYRDRWTFFLDLIVTQSYGLHSAVLERLGWYMLILLCGGMIGMSRWHDVKLSTRHPGATLYGLLLGLIILPTYAMTLFPFGAMFGAVILANLLCVFACGNPIALPRRQRQRRGGPVPGHPEEL